MNNQEVVERMRDDPIALASVLWPDITFYSKQIEIIRSVDENDETFVHAGNMLGKDFVSGYIALRFFLTRGPVRVVTTSADYSQLESVLWGEVRRFIQTAKYPLDAKNGGCIVVNHLHLRKTINNQIDPISYMIGRVAAKGEGLLGSHIANVGDNIPRTLFIADEGSGIADINYERAVTWAQRVLVIGNPFPSGNNFFERGCKGGDIPRGVRSLKEARASILEQG